MDEYAQSHTEHVVIEDGVLFWDGSSDYFRLRSGDHCSGSSGSIEPSDSTHLVSLLISCSGLEIDDRALPVLLIRPV